MCFIVIYILNSGKCGQGYRIGPIIARVVKCIFTNNEMDKDKVLLNRLRWRENIYKKKNLNSILKLR